MLKRLCSALGVALFLVVSSMHIVHPAQVRILCDETHAVYRDGTRWYAIDSTVGFGGATFAQLLREAGYVVGALVEGSISDEALDGVAVLVVLEPSPYLPYAPGEIEAVRRFVQAGGGLLLACEPWTGSPAAGANGLAEAFGASFGIGGVLRDPTDHVSYPAWSQSELSTAFRVKPTSRHLLTAGVDSYYIYGGTYIRTVGQALVLAEADADAWFDHGVPGSGSAWGNNVKESGEEVGPLAVLAIMAYGRGRIALLGDGIIFHNQWIGQLDAKQLVLNICDWLAPPPTVGTPHESPEARFTWQVLSSSGTRLVVEPRTGDRVSFDASASSDSDGTIEFYEWDWESDGTFETKVTAATAEHAFSTSGAHRVTLRVADDQGATGSVTKTVSVGEHQAPQASFIFSPSQPSVVGAVQFSDQSSDVDGQVVAWKWEFGDGTTSTDRNPTHTYSRKGTFSVKLAVTDDDGLTGTKTASVTVVNLPPTASFAFEPQAAVLGQAVHFDGSASKDRDGTVESYAWDFDGDGKTDTSGMEATWTFVEAKTYTVTLSVVDSDGATGTANKDVTVSAASSGPPRFQQQWGLVIGVGDYEDPAISDLTYTEADAQAFYDYLTSTQGGGFQKDHVRALLNEEATTASVKAAFRWLIGQAGAEDLVVIYFAGHGGTGEDVTEPPDEADGVDEYLVTYDAEQTDLFSTAVRDDEMADWLASFRCDNVVVILDSCFAAGATRSLEQTGTRAGPGNRVFNDLVGPGRLFLAASQEAELSYEDSALGHGVFTYYLLRGLGAMEGVTTPEADADQDGRVTVEELRIYLEREVTQARPQQHPLVTGDLSLTRVALDGYGIPLVGEVAAIQGDYVIISLGSRHGVEVGDRFRVIRPYTLPDGSKAEEVRALVQVAAILGSDRAACVLVESHFPIEIGDSVRPAQ